MILWFYNLVISQYIHLKLNSSHIESKHDPKYFIQRFMYHQKHMPDYISLGLCLLSCLFLLSLIFDKIFKTEKFITFSFSMARSSSISLIRNFLRFHDSIFEIANSDDPVSCCSILKKSPITNELLDFLVIGSGPGGSIAVDGLHEAGFKTCLLESGNTSFKQEPIPFSYAEMLYKYKYSGVSSTLGNASIAFVEGATLGGGSEVNSGLYHRPPDCVLNKWESKFGLQGLSDNEMKPYYQKIERDLKVNYAPPDLIPNASLKLQEGANNLNWSCQEVPRWHSYKEAGNPDGTRITMTESFLNKYLTNGGLLYGNSKAESVKQLDANKWAINVLKDDCKKVLLSKNVIFSSGTISTASLLKKSGLSNKAGTSFQMHPTIKVTAMFNEKVNKYRMGVPVHQVKEFSPDISFGCSISSKPYLRMSMLDYPDSLDAVENQWEYMAIYYAMILPEGVGSIRNVSVFKDPVTNYNLTNKDSSNLAYGLKKLCQLLLAAGATKLYPSSRGFAEISSIEDLARLPEKLDLSNSNLMSVHLFSSCPIGENRELCVADSYGKVFEKDHLYLSDGSMLPSAPGVNPQGSIMSLALRNNTRIIENS